MSRDALNIVLTRIMKLEKVDIFENSADFMARVEALPEKPDIFLLDIHIEPHTGFEMLSMLRANVHYQNATIIAITASVMNEEIETLKNAGFNGVIGKPISVATFPTLLEQVATGESIWHITDS